MSGRFLVMVSWYDSYCDVWYVEAGDEKEAIEKVKEMAIAKEGVLGGKTLADDYKPAGWEISLLPTENGLIEWRTVRD